MTNFYRPIYHFMSEKNWMNDPNGTIYYQGEHHLFYQYNPYDYKWNHMHWGHAKSKDLVHWERLPIALYPSKEKGENHCFSGCCIVKDGKPTIIYTSIGKNNGAATIIKTIVDGKEEKTILDAQQWMAISEDNMNTWEKYKGNPIVQIDLHKNMSIKEWRDPFIWRESDSWLMVLAGKVDEEGCIFIYKSRDLFHWEYLNVFYKENGVTLECPNIVKFDDNHYLLIFSVMEEQQVRYCTGFILDEYKLNVIKKGVLDFGQQCYYATNISRDDKNRVLLWGWLTESARGDLEEAGSWAGVQSLPRVLELQEDNKLTIKPIPEIGVIRGSYLNMREFTLEHDIKKVDFRGKAFEIEMELFISESTHKFGIKVLGSADGCEETNIMFDINQKSFSIYRDKSSLNHCVNKDRVDGSFQVDGKYFNIHIFVDYSVIEVFVNNEFCMSTRVYPTLSESDQVFLYTDGSLYFSKFTAWELQSIW